MVTENTVFKGTNGTYAIDQVIKTEVESTDLFAIITENIIIKGKKHILQKFSLDGIGTFEFNKLNFSRYSFKTSIRALHINPRKLKKPSLS